MVKGKFSMNDLQSELNQKQNEVFSMHSAWDIKYLHYNTVNNFIFHFNDINNNTDKEWIYVNLSEYLSICKTMNEGIDRHASSQLYDQYLDKIASYYRSNLGFIMIVSKTLYIIIYLVVFVLLAVLFNFLVGFLVVPLLIFHFDYIGKKSKRKEAYGVFY
jgi:hypothetical protein